MHPSWNYTRLFCRCKTTPGHLAHHTLLTQKAVNGFVNTTMDVFVEKGIILEITCEKNGKYNSDYQLHMLLATCSHTDHAPSRSCTKQRKLSTANTSFGLDSIYSSQQELSFV